MLTTRLRRLHSDERGVALIVAMAMLVVIGTIAAAVFMNSLQVKTATATERSGKQAYAAALNGLRSAMYWLNASAPADAACPPLPGQTTALAPDGTSGLCGPYESDNLSGAVGVANQPAVNQRFTNWISPVLGPSTDTCTGNAPVVLSPSSGTVVRNRCITAVGQALNGSTISATRRVQARVSATNAQFPVPGIFGASCLSAGVSGIAGKKNCVTGGGVSNGDYYGTIGSNGTVDVQMKTWSFDPSTTSVAPAALYLGYTDPASTTVPTYTIKLQQNPPGTPTPTGCGGSGLTFCNGSLPPLPYNPSATGPYPNPVHLFGRWYQPLRMGTLFAQPPPMVNGGSLPTGCTTTDVSACNNNALITSASSTPTGCATVSSNRELTLPNDCVLTLQNGTYDFCDITLGRTTALMPASPSPSAEIRIFLDSKLRTVGAGQACASSTQGALNWPNSSQFPRWMTNNANHVTATDCLTAFDADGWTALAGQLYVYGAGDPAAADTNYPPNIGSALDIIGVNFNGAIIATNSTVNLTDSNTCIRGAIAAGAVNIANNAGFKWDGNVSRVFLSSASTTFYRTAYSTCTAAGFRHTSTLSAPTYPTYPADGC